MCKVKEMVLFKDIRAMKGCITIKVTERPGERIGSSEFRIMRLSNGLANRDRKKARLHF